MKESVLTSVVLPLSLFLIMLGMGLSLTLDDFKRILKVPQSAAVWLLCQLVLLPVTALGLIYAFQMTGPLAVGVMLIAACPGGVTSNLITHVSRGDTALSITLTAITSFVTVLTIPLIVSASISHFMSVEQQIEMPVLKTIGQIVAITILPVSMGMLVRKFKLNLAERLERPSRIASSVIFALILVGIIAANKETIANNFGDLAGITIALNLLTMALGYGLARLVRLSGPQMRTIAIESGIQNGTLAIVIGTTILEHQEIPLPGGIYSLVMFITGAAMMFVGARQYKREEQTPGAA